MNIKEFGDALERQGMKLVCRDHIAHHEVFLADGFVTADRVKYLEFFGLPKIKPDMYPNGCYATIWGAEIRKGVIKCGCCVFEQLHDIVDTIQGRQSKRINTARVLADAMLKTDKMVKN